MASKPTHAPGEFIPLYWEEWAEALYVHGHVTPDEFAAVCTAEHPGPGVVPVPGKPVHRWAAWRFDGQDDLGNPRLTLHDQPERGRGMFPVTAADVVRWEVSPDGYDPNIWDADRRAEMVRKDEADAEIRNTAIRAARVGLLEARDGE